ncbi:MAG: hypothetical protein AB7F88_00110 [Pyrinomonadaceae bacterium]
MKDDSLALMTTSGGTETWSSLLARADHSVLVFTSVQCPYALAAYGTIERIAAKYSAAPLQFLLVNSNVSTDEDPEDIDAMRVHEPQPSMPFLRDETAELARLLGATHTPHVFLLDRSGEKLWSGPIDHRFKKPDDWTEESEGFWPWDDNPPPQLSITKLEEVLDQLVEKGHTEIEEEHPIGCTIK